MSIPAIYAKLSAAAALTALVGNRIEPAVASQLDARPFVTMEVESEEFGGTHAGSDGTATAILKLNCESTTYTNANAVAVAVRNALNFQKGTWGGIVVQGCFVEDEAEDYEITDNEHVYYGVTVRAKIIYNL